VQPQSPPANSAASPLAHPRGTMTARDNMEGARTRRPVKLLRACALKAQLMHPRRRGARHLNEFEQIRRDIERCLKASCKRTRLRPQGELPTIDSCAAENLSPRTRSWFQRRLPPGHAKRFNFRPASITVQPGKPNKVRYATSIRHILATRTYTLALEPAT